MISFEEFSQIVFAPLSASYPGSASSRAVETSKAVQRQWWADFKGFTADQLRDAVNACRFPTDGKRAYFPTSGQFMAACRIARENDAARQKAQISSTDSPMAAWHHRYLRDDTDREFGVYLRPHKVDALNALLSDFAGRRVCNAENLAEAWRAGWLQKRIHAYLKGKPRFALPSTSAPAHGRAFRAPDMRTDDAKADWIA